MSNFSIKTTLNNATKDEDVHEYDAQFETVVYREENASKLNELDIDQAPTEAEVLKTLIYEDLGLNLSDAVKNDINSDEPIRIINVDYGDTHQRNTQWVQYMKPEIITRSPIEKKSRGGFLAKVFFLVFFAFLVTGLSGAAVMLVPMLSDVFQGIIGLGAFCGSMFLFLITLFIMLSPCSINCPCNMFSYLFLVIAASVLTGYLTAHTNGIEFLVTIAVIGSIIFLFLMLTCMVNFMKPYLFVLAITLALGLYAGGIFASSILLDKKIVLINAFLGLIFTLFYLICVVLQVQMMLGGKGIEINKGNSIYGASMVFVSVVFVFVNILHMINEYNLL